MITEIRAKTLLNYVPQPDHWFGLKYNMNLYRGCQHQCIYCDSRSDCYQIENFADIEVKVNALELLDEELGRKKIKGTIGTGSMNDPYMPLEARRNLTGQALKIIARHRFPVHIITKSNLVLEDIETLVEINQVYAAVSLTITTLDDQLAKIIEPGAPSPSARLKAIETLSSRGIMTGVIMMPVLPFIEDNEDNIIDIVTRSAQSGAVYIIPSFGMTLRRGQREYYYQKLDCHFPGVRESYVRTFGNRYQAPARDSQRLGELFVELCQRLDVSTRIIPHSPSKAKQLAFC